MATEHLCAMSPTLDARSRERLKTFCKFGRLFEAQRLLDEKGTARLRKTRKWTPLFVAVDKGFHSLVEVLLRYDHAQWDLEKGYAAALRRSRGDLAGMILRSPWWTAAIDPVDALATGDAELVCSLIASGVDITKAPLVTLAALRNPSGTVACLRAARISVDSVEVQLRSALITHAMRGYVGAVVQLLRLGIDPHVPGIWFEERSPSGEMMSAVNAAIFSDKPGLLAMMKPSPDRDDPEEMIGSVSCTGDHRMLTVLLDAGFELNCQANGGSPALHEVLRMGGRYGIVAGCQKWDPHSWAGYINDIKWLIERGARWAGRDRGEYRHVRDALATMGANGIGEVMELLLKVGAISQSDVKELLRTPRMQSITERAGGCPTKAGRR